MAKAGRQRERELIIIIIIIWAFCYWQWLCERSYTFKATVSHKLLSNIHLVDLKKKVSYIFILKPMGITQIFSRSS